MKKNKISKNWINKQRRDIYVRQSKVDGYRSRAAYKLIEIDEKFKILKNGISLIDIGAAPGSWSQYASKKIKSGKIISIDLKLMDKIERTLQVQGDFTEKKNQTKIKKLIKSKFDVVLSDMAVNTTGNKNIDSIYTGELCKEAMFFSRETLKKEGKFVSVKSPVICAVLSMFSIFFKSIDKIFPLFTFFAAYCDHPPGAAPRSIKEILFLKILNFSSISCNLYADLDL